MFRLVAWCSDPSCVPSEMDLDIIEPPLADNISGPAKRVLRYPISITATPFNQPSTVGDPPSLPPADEERGHRRRRRRRRITPTMMVAPGEVGRAASMLTAPRVSVHERLGPQQFEGCHVLQDVSASAAPSIDRLVAAEFS